VELTSKNRFVADGHARWASAREDKIRTACDKNPPLSLFGKIQSWFNNEAAVLHERKTDEKASPKILW
jgi:hypothetical protein